MKSIYIIITTIILNFSVTAKAQNNNITLHGRVLDYVTRVQLPGAKVELLSASDSAVIASTEAKTEYMSGDDKSYSSEYWLNIPRNEGDYILRFSMDGFEPAYIILPLHHLYKREVNREVADACLKRMKTVNLDEVKVTATKVKFYNRGDTLVYNADAFQLSEGSMLDALIRQMPGAELGKDGRIYVNGKFVESLLLNGKDFFRGNNKVMLDNLPTYMVSNIKVYDRLGDDSRFLGHEVAGDKKYVMDVLLKKQYSIGWTANMESGYGTDDRYLARLFALRYTDHSRLAFYGNINNLNDDNKPEEYGSWSPSGMTGGLIKQQMGGIDYSVEERNGRYKLSGNAEVSHKYNNTLNNTNRTNFLPGGDTYDRIENSMHNRDMKLTTDHRFYFEFKDANIEITPNFRYLHYDHRTDYYSLTLGRDFSELSKELLDSIFSPSLNGKVLKWAINRNMLEGLTRGHSLEGSLAMKSLIKFRHSPDNITLYADASYRDVSEDMFDRNVVNYYSDGILASTDYRNRYFDNRPDRGYRMTGRAAYTYVVRYDMSIDWSYTYRHDYTSRRSSLYRLDQLRDWASGTDHDLGSLPSVDAYASVMDAANSYDSRQYDDSHTLEPFIVWGSTTKKSKWSGQLALPVSLLSRTMHYRRGDTDTTFTKRNLLLTVYSSYIKWNSMNHKYEVMFQYGLRPQAPDMNLFVNIHDTTDPLNITTGNPELKPSYTHDINSHFIRIYPRKGLMWAVEASFCPTQNAIAMGYNYDRGTGRRTFRPDNVNGNWNGKLSFGGGGALGKSRLLNVKMMAGMVCSNSVDMIGLDGLSASRSKVRTRGFTEMIKLNYQIGQSTIGLKSGGTWNRVSGTREDFTDFNAADFNYGMTAQLNLPWQFQLGTDLTMYSRRGYVDKSMNTDDLVWNAHLSRPFFKGKLVVMLDGLDLLRQLSNVTRTMNAQGITETYSNVIPRYVMLHASYRFNIVPQKKKQ